MPRFARFCAGTRLRDESREGGPAAAEPPSKFMINHRDPEARRKPERLRFPSSGPLGLCVSILLYASFPIAGAQTPASAQSADVSAVASAKADAAWRECQQTISNGPGDMKGKSRPEQMQMTENRSEKIQKAHHEFYLKYPDDVRRWDAVLILQTYFPNFYRGFTPDEKPIIDEAARAAWNVKKKELLDAMGRELPKLPARLQERFEARALFAETSTLFRRMEAKETIDWTALRAKVDAHAAKFSQEPGIGGIISSYLGMFERDHGAQSTLAEYRALLANPVVLQNSSLKNRFDVLVRETSKPMEMAFTAADGREVDLAKLRGKVVLIDFWATWCGPCVAEMPNVKHVYDTYRAKGFEVIGISLEDAHLLPGDTPDQVAAKHAAAKEKLFSFINPRGFTWPHHYDGKYWSNEIARGRFDVHSVPATFLLDQTGAVAAINARGPQLETEVKRLLGL
ncbi:MAG: redoxin domain-containing protein [Opitutus sp.]|nr:redoxin domain-containing protein [Opitutus sp.]